MPFDPKTLSLYPNHPGVYLMKNRTGMILYVGKAKNLRTRIRQYFMTSGDGREMIPFLVPQIESIETISVTSEKEALLLESHLIKKHKPKYNALLKDDKSYVALKINVKNPWPMLSLERYRGKPKADGVYFGPYTHAGAARRTLDLLHRLFPLRQCSDAEFARRTRPCILYDMKRCIAPCVQKCTKEEYQIQVDRTIKFLRGQNKEILQEMYQEMETYAENLEFEKAGKSLDTIRYIEKTIEPQYVDSVSGKDADALGIYRQGEDVMLCQLLFREGRLTSSQSFNFTKIADDDAELLTSFVLQHYQNRDFLPHEILLPIEIEDEVALTELLSENRARKVQVYAPKRGGKSVLIDMAQANAEASFKKEKNEQTLRENILLAIQEQFHLTNYPKRIECIDNSHIAGTEHVSSVIVFTDGKKDTRNYRTYTLKQAGPSDDYGAMREVLTRRYGKAKDENDLPDLLIIDGGKGHLNIALKVLAELDIISVNVIGIAKEQGRHDRGLTLEQVFLPNVKDPLILKVTSPILFILQQIRDEAHRFVIKFHRKRMQKRTIKSILDDVPGIGPAKKKALLKHFGSIKKIKEASDEELKKMKGISEGNIVQLRQFFAVKANDDPQ
ncbi:excinuclease ABC subunit UvrC [Parachlamydia acanthamoebae]|jgi:excinuclease ABC subunit C|uniref:excinuclease ABC subunit UvrC n=1 Tax=Parachlamydia acanthamoebae TaxID=83552 RepID=UPI000750CE82|nr:excinuclease ABC subunit UvrC [Parachlamydia acanthamoebae]